MHLSMQSYIAEEPLALTNEPIEYGWPDVRNGLHKILLGYLVWFGAMLLLALAVAYVVHQALTKTALEAAIDAGMIIFFGYGVMILLGLWSILLVIAGKLRCLISVPERAGAKWLMFSSMLCFLMSPALQFAASFVPTKVPPEKIMAVAQEKGILVDGRFNVPGNGKAKNDDVMASVTNMRDFFISIFFVDPKAYVVIAGMVAGLLHSVFFVLFLRAVARCFGDVARKRCTELYLLYSALLLVATGYVVMHPPKTFRDVPVLVLVLLAGWLVSLIWYLVLIVTMSLGIARGLELRKMEGRLAMGLDEQR